MRSPHDLVLPCTSRRLLRIALPLLALAIGLAWGGAAWVLALLAMFMLGRSCGQANTRWGTDSTAYGVGAALAGFRPGERG
ncbi:hypothetical protein [Pseudoduganella albidiflava]|uniref:Phosphatidate cytidylyltransferase n=1 Tax=Pseudoduganella albidiflava TaxID=321983 RepID=A0A411WTZ4_9BURK|nr:hypothetical protein [Pseudoduganella albidiflava]QBI00240.1 hypothetical protein EYF70_04770 [Pseudoduganella albidiflava]GGY52365.1 hypothetical protein GCM10007387_38220 [Pseudoduganella albidiflava]